jgi:hypothetical protein
LFSRHVDTIKHGSARSMLPLPSPGRRPSKLI